MSIETGLVEIIQGDGMLSGLIGTHVYPLLIPQDVDVPALAYQMISEPGRYSHDGDTGLRRARIQFTGQASTYAGMKTLMAALRAKLSAYVGPADDVTVQATFVENMRDEWAGTFGRPVGRMDVMVWYR